MTNQKLALSIRGVSPFSEDVRDLIAKLDRYQSELYPPESNHFDPPDVLAKANCRLLGAYSENGDLAGIAAAKIVDAYGELKRFYVTEDYRGQGVAEALLERLEEWLRENQIFVSRLETGIRQKAAIRFYQKMGYRECPPFGDYKRDPLSTFMEKAL